MKRNLLSISRKVFAVALVLICMVNGNVQVNATESIEYNMLTEEAKVLIEELGKDADNIQIHMPEEVPYSLKSDMPYVMISKTLNSDRIEGITYEEKEETILALSTQNGSFSASGQKYGIAASLVVNITWTYSDPTLSDLKIKFNSMTAKYTNLPTVSTSVKKMDYSVALRSQYGPSIYFVPASVNDPAAGSPYTTVLNSQTYPFGGEIGAAMITMHYANGDTATYEGILSSKN